MRCTNNANICSAQEETRSKKEKNALLSRNSSNEKLKKRIKRVTSTNTSWIMEEKKEDHATQTSNRLHVYIC